jgi:hypothetical protein
LKGGKRREMKGNLKEVERSVVKPTRSRGSGMGGGKQAPVGVKIISVLYYICTGFSVLAALLFFVGSSFIDMIFPTLAAFGSVLLIALGILCLAGAVLTFFIARGLWKVKKWARIIVIVFACLGILSVLSSFVSSFSFSLIIQLAIHGAVGGYLLFAKEVKEAFA